MKKQITIITFSIVASLLLGIFLHRITRDKGFETWNEEALVRNDPSGHHFFVVLHISDNIDTHDIDVLRDCMMGLQPCPEVSSIIKTLDHAANADPALLTEIATEYENSFKGQPLEWTYNAYYDQNDKPSHKIFEVRYEKEVDENHYKNVEKYIDGTLDPSGLIDTQQYLSNLIRNKAARMKLILGPVKPAAIKP